MKCNLKLFLSLETGNLDQIEIFLLKRFFKYMGGYQSGVHFGVASLKRGKESSKLPIPMFGPFFLKLLLNISLTFLLLKTKITFTVNHF